MKDTSIFEGIKLLGAFMFSSNGDSWKVWKLTDGAWILMAQIYKIENETNNHLYKRALELSDEFILNS